MAPLICIHAWYVIRYTDKSSCWDMLGSYHFVLSSPSSSDTDIHYKLEYDSHSHQKRVECHVTEIRKVEPAIFP